MKGERIDADTSGLKDYEFVILPSMSLSRERAREREREREMSSIVSL